MTLPHGAVGWSAVCECCFLIILTYFLNNFCSPGDISGKNLQNTLKKSSPFMRALEMSSVITSAVHLRLNLIMEANVMHPD